jgi:hypothetical protein
MTPVWEGTPSTRREPGGGNWGGSVWGFNIIQKGEPNETQPGDNYLRGGNQPGTEYWQVEIWPASEGGTRKPWIKPEKKWKTLKAAQDWSLKVLQGRIRVPGLRVAGTPDGRQVMASRVVARKTAAAQAQFKPKVKIKLSRIVPSRSGQEALALQGTLAVESGFAESPTRFVLTVEYRMGHFIITDVMMPKQYTPSFTGLLNAGLQENSLMGAMGDVLTAAYHPNVHLVMSSSSASTASLNVESEPTVPPKPGSPMHKEL